MIVRLLTAHYKQGLLKRRRHSRVAARRLLRLLEEQPDVTIEEAALAAARLVALTGGAYEEARATLPGHGRNSV
jgi:hypothetical protein